MTNAHRSNNSLDIIKIDGVWLLEEQEVREGVANAYQQMLLKIRVGRRILGGFN